MKGETMKRKSLTSILLCVMLILAMMLSACTNSSSNNNSGTNSGTSYSSQNLTLVTGGTSGAWYAGGALMAENWNKLPNVYVTSTDGGAESNVLAVSRGEDAQLGMTWYPFVGDAYKQSGMFEGKFKSGEKTNIKVICNFYTNYGPLYVASESSGIEKFEDIIGKRLLAGYTGSGLEYSSRELLNVAHASYDSIKAAGGDVLFADYTEAPSLMKDGHIDVFSLVGAQKHSVVLDIETVMRVKILQLSDAIMDEFIKLHPGFYKKELPGDTYSSMDGKPVTVLGYNSTLVCTGDLPDDLVYDLTKNLFEVSLEPLGVVNGGFKFMATLDNALSEINWDDVHPGAQRYFLEQGYNPNK